MSEAVAIQQPPVQTEALAMNVKRLDKKATHKYALRYDRVLIAPNLGGGGAQRVITILANGWNRRGERVCIITLFNGEARYTIDEAIDQIDISRADLVAQLGADERPAHVGEPKRPPPLPKLGQRLRRWLWAAMFTLPGGRALHKYYYAMRMVLRLRRVLQQLASPAVIAFTGGTNIITVMASIGQQQRVVISERNDPARQRLEPPWQTLRPYVYPLADVVTANTRAALATMARYVKRTKLVYIPNPLLIDERDRQAKSQRAVGSSTATAFSTSRPPSLLTVGRLHRQKAHDVLLMAFQRLPARLLPWHLTVLGAGELDRELKALALALEIHQRVDWRGWVADPHPYYQAAQIFVLPSRHEGMSNALLEAMMYELPVIVTDACEGVLELIVHGENGLVVPVNDPDALAAAIAQLADDPALRRRLGEAARQSVAAFTLPQILRQWDALLTGAVEEKNQR